MLIVNLFDALNGMNTTGTWTFSGGTPSPPAPVNYNDDIDFTGFAFGTRSYTYYVTDGCAESRATVIINYQDAVDPINDLCINAINLGTVLKGSNGQEIIGEYNLDNCPIQNEPIISSPVYPNGWITTTGDLWYAFTSDFTTPLIVELIGTQSPKIKQPHLAIYTGDCNNLTLVAEKVSNPIQTEENITFNPTPNTLYFIRVTSTEQGYFDLKIRENV